MEIRNDMVLRATVNTKGDNPHKRVVEFKVADMPQEAIERILAYGATRIFADPHGGLEPKAKAEAFEAMIEAFKRGEVGRKATVRATPLETLVRQIVMRQLKAKAPDKAKVLREADADERNNALDALAERNPHLVEEAKAELKRREREAKVEIDLGEL